MFDTTFDDIARTRAHRAYLIGADLGGGENEFGSRIGLTSVNATAPAIVLFDGICNLCNATVRFVIANDPDANFRFAALQSAAATSALAPFTRDPASSASIIVIDAAGTLYEGSSAALRVARGLRRPWRWIALLEAIPVGIRDPAYRLIARNRYRWFGRRTACALPAQFERERFLGEPSPAEDARQPLSTDANAINAHDASARD